MFYYGLDFHDLAPNSFLNISAFIVVCEAFLRIPLHFGLWLKIFNVKPKVVDGQHAECGGAMVSKMPKCHMAQRYFCGDRQRVAETVVLYHRAPRRHLGRGLQIQVRSSNAAYLLDGERPKLVFVG